MNADCRVEAGTGPSTDAHVIAGGGAAVDRLLAGIRKRQRVPLHAMPIEAARAGYDAATALLDLAPMPGIETRVHPLGLQGGAHLRVSLPAQQEPLRRVLLWVHGGGFCLGSARASDALCQWFAMRLGAAVVSVEYRLAPVYAVADALADVVAAIAWAGQRFPGLSIHVLGESAGASLALLAAARTDAAHVRSLALCYPLVHANDSTASRERYAEGHYLTMADLAWMHEQAGLDCDDAVLAPLVGAGWPAAMPRVLLALAHRDPLFDEGQALALRMRHAGVAVSELHLPDLIHGCLHMGGLLPEVREMHDHIACFFET